MSNGRSRSRLMGGAVAALLALAALPACDPEPRPAWVVTRVADGLDANVGDGVCEVTPGAGDCSLRAAVAEAEAAGAGDVSVRAGTYELTIADPGDGDPDLDVAGDVRINWTGTAPAVDIRSGSTRLLDVHAGGRVAFRGLSLTVSSAPATVSVVRVAGDLVAGESSITQGPGGGTGMGGPTVDVAAGATVLLSNSVVVGGGDPAAVVNRGTLTLRFSTVNGYFVPAVHTEPGGTTTVGASRLSRYTYFIRTFVPDGSGAVCTGAAVLSDGSNRVNNSTCGLTGAGDTQSGAAPWVDRIPVGTLGCGEAYVISRGGTPRPHDGDFDGIPACDVGAGEGGVWVSLTANGNTLRAATVGACYFGFVGASGGEAPYTWSATGLPPGLTLSGGDVTGIPEVAGTFEVEFRVGALDGGGSTTATMVVAPSDDPPMVSCD